ncbi:ATP-binding cassette domain-containing protein [uncultured Microbacterium sp.]|uniref:ATP-binding cassette domain-containing protein n=1 Tax=uncultured Microbacterium sp. TaxID=191216 RepID=UPI0025F27250|nr:ATP-binding cassette domain-containing protein [uncultured Microbacterium sp.]
MTASLPEPRDTPSETEGVAASVEPSAASAPTKPQAPRRPAAPRASSPAKGRTTAASKAAAASSAGDAGAEASENSDVAPTTAAAKASAGTSSGTGAAKPRAPRTTAARSTSSSGTRTPAAKKPATPRATATKKPATPRTAAAKKPATPRGATTKKTATDAERVTPVTPDVVVAPADAQGAKPSTPPVPPLVLDDIVVPPRPPLPSAVPAVESDDADDAVPEGAVVADEVAPVAVDGVGDDATPADVAVEEPVDGGADVAVDPTPADVAVEEPVAEAVDAATLVDVPADDRESGAAAVASDAELVIERPLEEGAVEQPAPAAESAEANEDPTPADVRVDEPAVEEQAPASADAGSPDGDSVEAERAAVDVPVEDAPVAPTPADADVPVDDAPVEAEPADVDLPVEDAPVESVSAGDEPADDDMIARADGEPVADVPAGSTEIAPPLTETATDGEEAPAGPALTAAPAVDDATALIASDDAVPALSLRGVSKTFGDLRAVDAIDLTVPAGSFYGLVGPNGAGKTTTLSIIAGLLRADAGSVTINGVDARKRAREAKKLIGVLPDRLRTFDRLTGRQLLSYYGALRGLPGALVESRMADLARAFDLVDALARPVSDYSAGMTKKVMLAGAMIHSPRMLVLDEPFEAVDPVSSAVILDILGTYVAHGGTVILSSHGMELVERVCSRVAVIVSGQVLAEGTVDEVRGEGTLEQRFRELSGGLGDVEGLEWLHTFSA